MLPDLILPALLMEAATFALNEGQTAEPILYGVTDGKAVGTYLEQKFRRYLQGRYTFADGNSAEGIDLPGLLVDIKTTSAKQPQSSCPFKSARQKVYGLGYNLLVFVYIKTDDAAAQSARLDIRNTIFVHAAQTADYQTTFGLRRLLQSNANTDDIVAFLQERMLPVDEIAAVVLAEEILANPPLQGYLTISNALQWRLQYSRVITEAGAVAGVERVR